MYTSGTHGKFKTYLMKSTFSLKEIKFPTQANEAEGYISMNNGDGGYNTALFAYGTFGDRINKFVTLFDRWRIKSLVYSFIPSCATSAPGGVYMAYRRAPKDFTSGGAGSPVPYAISLGDASQLERYSSAACYQRQDLPVPTESEFLYCGALSGVTSDIKWYCEGWFGIGTNGAHATDFGWKLGDLVVTVVVECYGMIPPDKFPAIVSPPSIIRCLGMSLYQQPGQFRNEDLRNLFLWSNFILKGAINRFSQKLEHSIFYK
jgi:hypothetical protein